LCDLIRHYVRLRKAHFYLLGLMLTAQKTGKVPDDLMAQLRMLRDLPEYRAAMEETEALIAGVLQTVDEAALTQLILETVKEGLLLQNRDIAHFIFRCRSRKCRQTTMFIGVSGNAPFLETYWRHIFLTYLLALAGGDSRQNPRNAPMNSGGCHSPRRWRMGARPRHLWSGSARLWCWWRTPWRTPCRMG